MNATSSATTQSLQPEATNADQPHEGGWLRGVAVRFGVLYTTMFLLTRAVAVMPGSGGLRGQLYQFKLSCVQWVGRNLLRLDEPVSHLGTWSGDQVYDWVQVVILLGLAAIGAVIWMAIDRKPRHERVAAEIVRVLLRYRLCMIMLAYGMPKLLWEQMPQPNMARLLQPYGESSPMSLLWTFMGQSWAYSAFTGAAEFVGGFLLLFRRTTTLGALIIAAVMANVLMMNFTFDVPVKLYSMHYLIFAVALAAPDLRRLADVLWFHRGTSPVPVQRAWRLGRATRFVPIAKALVVAWIVWYFPVQRTWRWLETPRAVKSDLYGIFEVEKFSRDGVETPPVTTDAKRWRRVAFDVNNQVTVVLMDDSRIHLRLKHGAEKGRIMFEPVQGDYAKGQSFTYALSGADRLLVEGRLDDGPVSIELRRADDRRLLLREQGFRWISEDALFR